MSYVQSSNFIIFPVSIWSGANILVAITQNPHTIRPKEIYNFSSLIFRTCLACFKAYNARVQFFQKAENKAKKAKMHKNIKRIGKLLIFFSCIHFFFA